MNKRAKEKQLLEEAYTSIYSEAKEAPKGKHYDSAGRLRSGDADADGRGGPKYRSDPTYENPNEDAEGRGELTISGPIKIGDHVYKVGSNDPLGSGKISKIIEYSNGYMIFTRDEYGGLMSHMVDLEGQAVDEGYLKNKDGESYSKEEAAEDKVYDHIDGLINIKDKERLVHLFKLAIADPRILDLDVVTSIHDDLKKEGFDVDDINDYIVATFKFTLGG